MRSLLIAAAVIAASRLVTACGNTDEAPPRPAPQKIRVAVVGGMIDTGFWPALAARYERLTGHTVELAATGPKPVVVAAFRKGGVDLITVHASDAMVNLVAEGLAKDPQPWVMNDLVIMGPVADPAKIRGQRDALAALRAIVATRSKFLVHASLGADGVLHDLQETGKIVFEPGQLVMFDEESQQRVLQRAAAEQAYTMVGRIPVLSGKLKADGMTIAVQGDPRMRRPYLVEVATNANAATHDLAEFLRLPDTQRWIASYGKGKYDDQPLFFPVTVTN
jgi:tungstate transport system substrate-binding protein